MLAARRPEGGAEGTRVGRDDDDAHPFRVVGVERAVLERQPARAQLGPGCLGHDGERGARPDEPFGFVDGLVVAADDERALAVQTQAEGIVETTGRNEAHGGGGGGDVNV